MMKLLGAACALLLSGASLAVDFGRGANGTSGSEFLLFDTNARGVSLGGAMAALTDDSGSIYWNPAGLTQIPHASAGFMHAQYVADITYDALSFARRASDNSVFAGGMRYLDGGSVGQTDLNGASVGSFHPHAYVGELGWGQIIYDLSDREVDVSMGVTARVIHSDFGSVSADGFGGDLGVQSRFFTSDTAYDIGLVLQNVGSGQKFGAVRDSLPTRLRIGGSVKPTKLLALSLEMIAPINDAPAFAAGVEYGTEIQHGLRAVARAGANTLTYQSLGLASILSCGLGLGVKNVSFDYAFSPMGPLGTSTHRFSLSYNLPSTPSHRHRVR